MSTLDEETQEAWRRLMTFEEEMQELRYAWGELVRVVKNELKASAFVNLIIRCLLKVCNWLED